MALMRDIVVLRLGAEVAGLGNARFTEEVQRAVNGGESEVRGLISEFASKARLRVAGQLVDASAAVFDGGTEAGLRNGRVVEVEGRLVDGVLRAARVEFED